MAGLQSLLRAMVPTSRSPREVLSRIHRLYRHNFRFTTFVSVFLMAVDLPRRELSYVNAGHNPPALVRPDPGLRTSLTWLMPTGPALGLTEEAEYAERTVPFGESDMLTIYTDGIPELFDLKGEQFGQDRLEALLREAAPVPAPEAVRIVREELQGFIGEHPPSDDITLIVLRGTGS
jgi:sigma-B regulation protein RsbU (phosphoserine phosphatase)